MTSGEKILLERWQRRAANLTPDLIRGILVTYDRIRGLLSPSELARAFEDGTLFDLIDAVLSDNTQDPALAELRALLGETGLESARQAARDLPRRVATTFGVLNPRVLEAARTVTDRVLANVRAEVKETVRETVVAGIEAGKGPRTIANRIIQNVGLPPQYARAVENFRAELEAGDRKALSRALARGSLQRPDGSRLANRFHAGSEGLTQIQLQRLEKTLGSKPLTPQQIDTLVNSYSKRLHAWHAETLARTAALDAQRAGQRAVWADAIDKGQVDPSLLWKRWRTVGDSRVRPEHRALNGTEVHFDAAFPNGEVTPGERSWNCRCQAIYFLKRKQDETTLRLEDLGASDTGEADLATGRQKVLPEVIKAEKSLVGKPYEYARAWHAGTGESILFGKLWNRPASKVEWTSGDPKKIEFSDNDLPSLKDAILTHNHPSGAPFSPSDVRMALRADLYEVRAVGRKYTFSLIRPAGGWDHAAMDNAITGFEAEWKEYVQRGEGSIANAHNLWKKHLAPTGAEYTVAKTES